jgi:hypothetical protein
LENSLSSEAPIRRQSPVKAASRSIVTVDLLLGAYLVLSSENA